MPTGMKWLVGGLLVSLVGAVGLFAAGLHAASQWCGLFAPFVWVNGMVIWVAAFDAKKRWPGEPFMRRFGSIMTFRRDSGRDDG